MLYSFPNALRLLLAYYLWGQPYDSGTPANLNFHLRHVHAVTNTSRNIFSDVIFPLSGQMVRYAIQAHPIIVPKPPSFAAFTAVRQRSVYRMENEALHWRDEKLFAPDVGDRQTLLQLAKMTSNSYSQPGNKDWYDIGPDWNNSFPMGWEPDADGFRGHVFVSSDESIVIISIKGTSVPIIGGGPTVSKDKLNDNLLFSCCCARVGPTWSTVCGCYEGGYKCDTTCVENSLIEESLFYPVGINLYNNVSYMYPKSDIWVIGHSLGGALASLLGTTFGAPVVAFEAPAERMAARRLHLPSPPSTSHVTHIFNTADPISMGQCTGVTSTCANLGYAMESQCHQGKIIKYDTVGKLGWRSSVASHAIKAVIDMLSKDWDEGMPVPQPVDEDPDCVDCFQWEFGDYRNISVRH